PAAVRFAFAYRPTRLGWYGARAWADHHRLDGCWKKRVWNGQRVGIDAGDRTNRCYARTRHRPDEEASHSARGRYGFYAFFPDHHFRLARAFRRGGNLAVSLSDGLASILEHSVADSRVSGCFYVPDEATAVWLHHCDHRLLLRTECPRRNPGCGPCDHPGGRRIIGIDPGCRLTANETIDDHLCIPVTHECPSQYRPANASIHARSLA